MAVKNVKVLFDEKGKISIINSNTDVYRLDGC